MGSNSKRNKLASGITNSLNIQAMAEVMATVIGRGIIAAILYGWTLDDNKQTIHCTNTTTYHTVGTDVTEQGWSTADFCGRCWKFELQQITQIHRID